MSFLIPCPVCGLRDVYEFRFGGEVLARPAPDASPEAWTAYRFLRTNPSGPGREWWFHRTGCRRWLQADRDTATNRVTATGWAGRPLVPADASRSERTADG